MKHALFKCLAGFILSVACNLVAAFPIKPVTIVVPAPPGGSADTVIRSISARLASALGQPVLIDNKAGASGVIASQYVAGAPADGHTLLMNYTSHAINPWLMAKLPYDTTKSFAPVALLGTVPLLLAVPIAAEKSAAELIDKAGLELFVTLRRDPVYGLVTVIGRGGTDIEVDPDYVVHVGPISEWQVPQVLSRLRCARLFDNFRGRPALAREELARSLVQLQQALLSTDLVELELNPVKLTPTSAWILDALATGLAM